MRPPECLKDVPAGTFLRSWLAITTTAWKSRLKRQFRNGMAIRWTTGRQLICCWGMNNLKKGVMLSAADE